MVLSKKKEFVNSFIALNDDSAFVSAISDTAKETRRVCTRFTKFAKLLNEIQSELDCKVELKFLTIKEDGIEIGTIS